MTLLLIIGVLIIIFSWLLFSPLYLQIDTRRNEYALRWVGIAEANLIPLNDDVLLRLRLPFWRKDFSIIKFFVQPTKNKQERTRKATPKQQSKTNWRFFWNFFQRILKSFRVHYFKVELDTDDYVMNAYLYPVCHFLNSPDYSVSINFQGRNQCWLRVENRLAWVLFALISSLKK